MPSDFPFLHLIFVGFISLFPAVNPVGSAFIVDPLLSGLDLRERRTAAKKVAFYCCLICCVSVLIGSWILKLFGISIPIVQLAGGIMICRMGWQLLTSDDAIKGNKETARPDRKAGDIDNLLFYPVAFPMTTGAGTISVLLTLSAHEEDNRLAQHVLNLGGLFVAIFLMCVLIYICYAHTPRLIRRLGPRGEQIVNRISAFLVFCIGMQIASAGIRTLLTA
ncbi:MAG: MarC family protein [Bacteroidota bacterium]|nr:MarC family protein [Bacteroidota bacterium]MDP4215854.1 MarC family protein [Bacteroidota bacterium]MDP4247937.1 MarC family protein [Bacteroidota bacterium]MDP4254000.1 MarC family protein [Bacteroidota bacterium]MDP4258411.1 MarC family protein [Bacteroidota bacterium]